MAAGVQESLIFQNEREKNMIHALEIKNYRAVQYAAVELSEFQVLVGPNGSGKSTFLDVFSLVSDILNFGLEEAIAGSPRIGLPLRADDARDMTFLRQGGDVELAVTLKLPDQLRELHGGRYTYARYELAIDTAGGPKFSKEALHLLPQFTLEPDYERSMFPELRNVQASVISRKAQTGWRKVLNKVVESGNDYFQAETGKWNNLFRLGASRPALKNLPEDEEKFPAATWAKRFLMEGVYRLMLNAEAMRLPSSAALRHAGSNDGSTLPWLVHELEQKNQEALRDWEAHLRTALPDLRTVCSKERPEDRSRYVEITFDSGLSVPSWLLSDGTLRLLVLTLLAYAPPPAALLMIEEPENGIHPRAMETVIQSLSSVYDAQLFCATHSPVVLSMIEPSQLLCFGKNENGSVDLVRGDQHPRLREWQSEVHMGDLFAAGVLG